MLIHYDQEVIAIAQRIAHSKTATRGDVVKLIQLNEHHAHLRSRRHAENMPYSNYLGREARNELIQIAQSLPRRRN